MAVVKKISELTPKGANLANNDLLIVGVSNGTDYDLKSVTGAELLSTAVAQTITNGVTTTAPSQDAVYDALQNKVDKVTGSRLITSEEGTILSNTSGTNTGDETSTTIKSKLGITTLSGSNTGDQDLSSYAQTSQVVTLSGNQTVGGVKSFTNNTTHDSGLKIKHGSSVTSTGYTGIGANVDSLIIGVVGASQTLQFPNTNNFNYTFPASTGTLATTSDLSTKVDANSAITGATKTKITYDSKGLVTAGADATTADIADSLNKRYVTDANLTTLSNTSGTNTGDQIISDATLTTSDITTNNVSTSKHGFVPKAPNNTTQFLRGDGTWATPSAGGLTYFTEAQSTASPNATVNVDSLTAVASTTNADFAIRPKGTGAILANIPDNLAAGGNKRGLNAVDLQISRSNSAQVASGDYSVLLGGSNNTVSGVYSMVGGVSSNVTGARSFAYGSSCTSNGYCSIALSENATASGDNSFAHGLQTSATGYASVAIGRNAVSSNVYSMAFGAFTIADANSSIAFNNNAHTFGVTGRIVFSSTGIGTRGDAQSSKLVLRKLTTDNTPTILTSDNGSVASANQLTLSNNNTIRVKGTIIGRQTGSTNTSAWDIDCLIQRGVGVGTTTLLISNVNVVQNTPAWGTPTLTANTTLGCLTVTVTGAITTNIQWVCVIDTAEVIYA